MTSTPHEACLAKFIGDDFWAAEEHKVQRHGTAEEFLDMHRTRRGMPKRTWRKQTCLKPAASASCNRLLADRLDADNN
jgi:hypothetical protein